MKKLTISFIFFFSFFNGVLNNGYSDTKLYDTEEATIEVDSARLDKDNLQISWLINGIENIDEVILSVRELTPDGLLGEPLEYSEYSNQGQKIIEWDGSSFPSGIYFYLVNAGKFFQTEKIILLK